MVGVEWVSSSGSRRRRDDIKRISLQRNALLFVGAVALPCARLLLDIRHQKSGRARLTVGVRHWYGSAKSAGWYRGR
jgi:hypothetical protein